MSMAYTEMLKRLKEERVRLGLLQEDMAKHVRMSQSHYSKIEKGFGRLSYYELQYLCGSGVDFYYVYTDERFNGKHERLLLESNVSKLRCYLDIIYSVSTLDRTKDAAVQWRRIFDRVQYIPLFREDCNSRTLFFKLRRSLNWQQQKMAVSLGIDIKKLRDLETGKCLVDSELLVQLYDMFHISPAVIMGDRNSLINEISILLEMMKAEERRVILEFFQALHDMN